MGYKREAIIWVFLHFMVVGSLTGVFMWNHYKVADSLKEYAQPDIFVILPDPLSVAYSKWYSQRLMDGTAFWFPDMGIVYLIMLLFPVVMLLACLGGDELQFLSKCFSLPAYCMGAQMMYTVFTDIRLYLNALPRGPLCGCAPPSPTIPFHDCRCVIPFHEGEARVLAANPYDFTTSELEAAGVDPNITYSANNTIQYIEVNPNSTTANLQPWQTFEFSLEFVITQASVFVVIMRLRPYRIYQKHCLGLKAWSLFHAILENQYYMLAESLDALSLFNEFVENGDYFINDRHLVNSIYIFTAIIIILLLYSDFPTNEYGDKDDAEMKVSIFKLGYKISVVLFSNLPLLVIRIYLMSLYSERDRGNIIFILFIVREIAMLILGITDFVTELISMVSDDDDDE